MEKEPEIRLTETDLQAAVIAFATGSTPRDIIDRLVAAHPEWKEVDGYKETLHNLLRPVNPNCNRFAVTKYWKIYETAHNIYLEDIKKTTRETTQRFIKHLDENLKTLDSIKGQLREAIASANTTIEETKDLNATIGTLIKIQTLQANIYQELLRLNERRETNAPKPVAEINK